MTVAESHTRGERETIEVIRWRLSRLVRRGYELEHAITLATHLDVDLHRAVDLVARGCPPSLALRILI